VTPDIRTGAVSMHDQPVTDAQPFGPRYEIVGFVGEGAAAKIYKVVDHRSGATRAIKALKPEANAEPSIVKRFEDEYLILRRLHHPSLPEMYDYGFADDGIRYMVMDLVEGQTLDVYFKEHPEDLWLLLYELCEVLTFIHDRDLLHLDVKPANILVKRTTDYGDEMPMAVLLDFGLTYRRDAGGERSLVGTPQYMAPEIIRGDERLTRAADYYSLGITLYQLLAGEPPFRGEIRDIFAGHLGQEVRFKQEKTEYAELYPHVVGLVGKEVSRRLETFERFRRAVIGRLGRRIGELNRVLAISAIRSLGIIGQKAVISDVAAWAETISKYLRFRNPEAHALRPEKNSSERITSLRAQRLSKSNTFAVNNAQIPDAKHPNSLCDPVALKAPPNVYVLNGAPGMGTSLLVEQLIEWGRLNRWACFYLRDDLSESLSNTPNQLTLTNKNENTRPTSVDPTSALIDRHTQAWLTLIHDEQSHATVLAVEHFEELDGRHRTFLEYVAKRLELARGDKTILPVYIVITGDHPRLDAQIDHIFGSKQTRSCVLSSLTELDIEDVISRLRGRPVTENDKRNLYRYLKTFEDTPEAVPAALQNMVVKGHLQYTAEQWKFDFSERRAASPQMASVSKYYKEIPSQLDDPTNEVLAWIVCHYGPISVPKLSQYSGISISEINNAISDIRPYRILDVATSEGQEFVSIFRRYIQATLYDAILKRRRLYIHRSYICSYEADFTALSDRNPFPYTAVGTQLLFHYSKVEHIRPLLNTVIRVIKALIRSREYYELRSFCNDSLATLSGLNCRDDETHIRSVRRYILERLLEANWTLEDYESVRQICRKVFRRRLSDFSVKAAFRCGLASMILNDYGIAMRIADSVKERFPARRSQGFNTASILEASVLIQNGRVRDALVSLDQIEQNSDALSEYGKCRLYSAYVIAYDRLSDKIGISKYLPKLEDIALRNSFYHEYQFCLLAPFNFAFNRSMLRECKITARRAIKTAIKHRSYRRLCDWYFRASAVYYEDGAYDRALNYVNKAMPIAERLGLVDEVPALITRLAMIYLNLGAYGNAIKHMEKAISAWNSSYNVATGAVIFLFAFETHLISNSGHVLFYYKKATEYMRRHKEVGKWGYYWYLVGVFNISKHELRQAAIALKKARGIYDREGSLDDAVRSGLKEVLVLLELDERGEALKLIKMLGAFVRDLESGNIKMEYWTVRLSYSYYCRLGRSVMERDLRRCEQSFDDAREIPVLLAAEKIMFRAKARLGDLAGARKIFNSRVRRLKNIVSNMPSQSYASDYLSRDDEQLLLWEAQMLKKKGH
jgi:serine/threonine protein kinase/tetratricopeptide (TPR) repeat protein